MMPSIVAISKSTIGMLNKKTKESKSEYVNVINPENNDQRLYEI